MAAEAGVWYWNFRNCNKACDAEDYNLLTRMINGGLNGFEDRKRQLNRIRRAMNRDDG
jgi:putative chitinase